MPLKRLLGVGMALVLLFAVMLGRVYWISTDTRYAASAGSQILHETALPTRRGDFYDCRGRLLTGLTTRWYALCIPGDGSYSALFPYVPYAAQETLYRSRNAARPFLIEVGRDLSAYGVHCYQGSERYLPLPIACHLIGYVDGEGHGVSGLERAYEDVLAAAWDRDIIACATTARGALLTGSEPQRQTTRAGTGYGVRLTLDADIQRAAEAVARDTMARGCLLVLDTATAEVRASVSMPEFDPNHVAKSIAANDTSLINRTLAAFSAGSVFKVVLAVAAYEAGLDWYTHNCDGYEVVSGQIFRCAQGRAHGLVNLRGALENSCNCYFINLGRALGADRILETARAMGFGTAAAVAPGLKSTAGLLPTAAQLQNPGQLAMLSFGQGSLTVTPLQIAGMMNTVAAGGTWRAPRLVQGVVESGSQELVEAPAAPEAVRVCGENVARVLRSMLRTVVEEGTGGSALPNEGGAGGKTGTAQTGQYNAEGSELINYWFAGFWPAENPRYTIVVLQDAVREPAYSSAQIFARVANSLLAMERQPAGIG